MKNINTDEYLSTSSYFGFLTKKLTRGQLWKTAASLFDKIRKYTFISSVVRVIGFVIALLEKSAILLLAASALFLLLPLCAAGASVYFFICALMHLRWNRKIRNWLITGETVTFFITKERVFSTKSDRLFLRDAKSMACKLRGPVIVVCSDPFICAKWYSINLLAVKEDYFFVLKRKFIEKNRLSSTFIIL